MSSIYFTFRKPFVMLVAFLIMLREGIEAALIVGIVAGFLKQSGHTPNAKSVVGCDFGSNTVLGFGVGYSSCHR